MPEKSDFKNYIKVCIIDDDESYRLLLKKVLEIDDRIKLYGEYSTGKSFIKDLGSPFKPDVCLVDIYLNDISGIECCKQIKEKKPEVHLIVMTAHPDPQTFVEARKLGADYLQKGTRVEAIINKIITSYESKRGESLISLQNKDEVKFNNIQLTMELEAVKQRLSKLSKKQLQVIKFKSLGKTVDEIAKDLNTEPGTIHVHVSRALKKLQLPSLLPYLFNDNQD